MSLQPVQVLSPLIAERIAAGEVVERPASVVKELVENSLDAGATQIEVRLLEGGIQSIEVMDNGSGMSAADLELSVCRHATSKIRNIDDLMSLGSLGFRGEALPSIAAVSNLTITSRANTSSANSESTETFQVVAHQTAPMRGKSIRVANENFLGSPHGTRIEVTSLFSQIPARLKFLKSPASEASAIREVLERLSFTHPQTRFKLSHDTRVLLDLPIEPLSKRVQRILAGTNPFELIHVQLDGAWAIELFWLKGLSLPNTRSLIQVVNGRSLRDRTLQQALLLPFKQSFLPGQFPVLLAVLNIPKDELDVNVHPAKTEIRFLDPKKIFALCHAAVQNLIEKSKPQHLWATSIPLSSATRTFDHGTPSEFLRDSRVESSGDLSAEGWRPSESFVSPEIQGSETPFAPAPLGEYRGILFGTYIVFEQGEELIWIDQHAAHERIRYEQLKRSVLGNPNSLHPTERTGPDQQQLLVPEVIKVQPESAKLLQDRLHRLTDLGFDAEVFGEDSVVFRSIPSVWGTEQISTRLYNLLERLQYADLEGRDHLVWDEVLFEKVAMEACRSSYKAGDYLSEENAIRLTQRLLSCEHFGNCPHGRPTVVRVSKTKVEEWFQRKI